MFTPSWIRKMFARTPRTGLVPSPRPRHAVRPRLEVLEDRLAPADFTLTSVADDGSNGTLRWAMDLANQVAEPSTITIPGSIFPVGIFDFPGIKLNGTPLPTVKGFLTIVGQNQFAGNPQTPRFHVSGDGKSRVFEVGESGSLSLSNFIIENGSAADFGGAILNQGILNLDQVTVTSSKAVRGGGIATAPRSILTIDNSIISNNTASENGGGIYAAAGAAYLEVDHSTITGNTSKGSGGGVATGAVRALFSHDTITNNSAIGADATAGSGGVVEGGGVAIAAGSVSVIYTTIDGNVVQGGKGGTGTAGTAGTNYAGSRALPSEDGLSGGNGGNGSPGSAGGFGWGGGIAIEHGSLALFASTISNNVARGGAGGAGGVGGKGGEGQDGGESGGVFSSFTRGGNGGQGGNGGIGGNGGQGGTALGGGLYVSPFATNLTMTNTTVANNQAVGGQGGVSAGGGDGGKGGDGGVGGTDLSGNRLSGHGGDGGDGGVGGHDGAGGAADGGGIHFDAATSPRRITDSTIAYNAVVHGPLAGPAVSVVKFNGEPAVLVFHDHGGKGGAAGTNGEGNTSQVSNGSAGTRGRGGRSLVPQPATGGGIGRYINGITDEFNLFLHNSIVALNTQNNVVSGDATYVTPDPNNRGPIPLEVTTASDISGSLKFPAASFLNLIGTGGAGGLVNGSSRTFSTNRVNVSDPGLRPLGNYGGETRTVALEPDSPAIDPAGGLASASVTLPADQRGLPRFSGATRDTGAFEHQQPVLSPAQLPGGTYGATYNQTITATGEAAPYTFAVPDGGLPAGLTLADDGALSGTPAATGSFSFTVTVTDSHGFTASRDFSLKINQATLTITAASRDKDYGQAVTFAGTEFTASGLLNDDAVTGVTLTSAGAAATAAASGSPYAILASNAQGSGLDNYDIHYADGTLTVNKVPPTVAVPAPQTAFEDVDAAIGGITVGDPEGDSLTVTLSVGRGTLTLSPPTGLTVTGNGSASVTLVGGVADLNAVLATLAYRGRLNYGGDDALLITATDGSLTTTGSVPLSVKSAARQAADLKARVNALRNAGVLSRAQAQALAARLKYASDEAGEVRKFLKQVAAYRAAGILTSSQANLLRGAGNVLLLGVTRQ